MVKMRRLEGAMSGWRVVKVDNRSTSTLGLDLGVVVEERLT